MILVSRLGGAAAASYEWPTAGIGQRTSDRVSAGKQAAKYIACGVCEERLMELFVTLVPGPGDRLPDEDSVTQFLDGDGLGDALGDAKSVCEMRDLAKLFRSRRMEVQTNPDGSAVLSKVGVDSPPPFYEEINKSELAFHWKSFAVQHACTETFRRDGDAVAKEVIDAYRRGEDSPGEEPGQRLAMAAKAGCRRAKTCRAATKKIKKAEL